MTWKTGAIWSGLKTENHGNIPDAVCESQAIGKARVGWVEWF